MRATALDQREQRELRQGAGDALAASFEMIASPAIFAFLGWLVDRWLGVFPVFTLLFGGVVLAYQVWRMYVQYSEKMDRMLEERRGRYGGSAADG